MDTTVKVTSIHVIFGILAAAVSFLFSTSWIGFKNDVFAGILPFIIVYFVGQLTQKMYGEEVEGFSQWLWDGILPFGFIWIVTFTILYNYIPF